MKKGQASIEYLIIITAVLVISSVVVLFLTQASNPEPISLANCQKAASSCKLLKAANPNDPCLTCTNACVDAIQGTPVLDTINATNCCVLGNTTGMFSGATVECT